MKRKKYNFLIFTLILFFVQIGITTYKTEHLITNENVFVKRTGFEELINFFHEEMDSKIEIAFSNEKKFWNFGEKEIKYVDDWNGCKYVDLKEWKTNLELALNCFNNEYQCQKLNFIGLNKLRIQSKKRFTYNGTHRSPYCATKYIDRNIVTISRTALVFVANRMFILTRELGRNFEIDKIKEEFWVYEETNPIKTFVYWQIRTHYEYNKNWMSNSHYDVWINVGFETVYGMVIPFDSSKFVPFYEATIISEARHHEPHIKDEVPRGETRIFFQNMYYYNFNTNILRGVKRDNINCYAQRQITRMIAQELIPGMWYENGLREWKEGGKSKEQFQMYCQASHVNDYPTKEFIRRFSKPFHNDKHFKEFFDENIKNKKNVMIITNQRGEKEVLDSKEYPDASKKGINVQEIIRNFFYRYGKLLKYNAPLIEQWILDALKGQRKKLDTSFLFQDNEFNDDDDDEVDFFLKEYNNPEKFEENYDTMSNNMQYGKLNNNMQYGNSDSKSYDHNSYSSNKYLDHNILNNNYQSNFNIIEENIQNDNTDNNVPSEFEFLESEQNNVEFTENNQHPSGIDFSDQNLPEDIRTYFKKNNHSNDLEKHQDDSQKND